MRYRLLVALPLVAALAVALGSAAAGSAGGRAEFFFYGQLASELAAVAGCLVAASRFAPADHLWRGWFAYALSFAVPLVNKALHGLATVGVGPPPAGATVIVLATAANAFAALGALHFASTARRSGMALPGAGWQQRLALVAGALVACAIVSPALVIHARAALAGDAEAVASAVGDAGDILIFVLVTPILLTAMALRGGALWWPWALITAGNLIWLLFDVVSPAGQYAGLDPVVVRTVREMLRCSASVCYLCAGLAQRWAVRGEGGAGASAVVPAG